jgi:hypothetical protein
MKKRKRILLAVVVVAVLGGLAWVVLREPSEPVYQGKKLSVWLDAFSVGFLFSDWSDLPDGRLEAQTQATKAVRACGTNAIPILLRMAGTKDSLFKSRIREILRKQSLIHFKLHTAKEYHEMAFCGFLFLGSVGKPAVPQLLSLLNNSDPDIRRTAVRALHSTKSNDENTIRALTAHLNDSDKSVREAITNALKQIDPEAASKAGVK